LFYYFSHCGSFVVLVLSKNFSSFLLSFSKISICCLPPVPNLFFAILPVNPLKFTSLTGVICLGVLGKENSSLIVKAGFSVPLVL
jgi:hypothetical protein